MSDKSNPTITQIVATLDTCLDDESTGKWVYLIPVSAAVALGLGGADTQSGTIAAVCKQVLKRLVRGDTRAAIMTYLKETIGFDERFSKAAIGQTMDAAKYGAAIIDGKMTDTQAIDELSGAKNADREMIVAMLEMVQKLHRDEPAVYTTSMLRGVWRPPDEQRRVPGFCVINLIIVSLWPILCFGFSFRWWTGLLTMVGAFWLWAFHLYPAMRKAYVPEAESEL